MEQQQPQVSSRTYNLTPYTSTYSGRWCEGSKTVCSFVVDKAHVKEVKAALKARNKEYAIHIIRQIEDVLKSNFINDKSREATLVMYRKCLIYILRCNFSLYLDQIAKLMYHYGKAGTKTNILDHATVVYNVTSFQELLDSNDVVAHETYEEFRRALSIIIPEIEFPVKEKKVRVKFK